MTLHVRSITCDCPKTCRNPNFTKYRFASFPYAQLVFINGEAVIGSPVEKKTIRLATTTGRDYPEKSIPMECLVLVGGTLYRGSASRVVNKPEGMKTLLRHEIALLNHVSAYCGQTCYVVHRLDMELVGCALR